MSLPDKSKEFFDNENDNHDDFINDLDDILYNSQDINKDSPNECWENEKIALQSIYDDLIEFINPNEFTIMIKYDIDNLSDLQKEKSLLIQQEDNLQDQINNSTSYHYLNKSLKHQKAEVDGSYQKINKVLNCHKKFKLHINVPNRYPIIPANFNIIQDIGSGLDGYDIVMLTRRIRNKMITLTKREMIYDIIEDLKTNFHTIIENKYGLNQIELSIPEEEYYTYTDILYHEIQVNDPTIYVGHVNHVVKDLIKNVRIINIENILRPDLIQRFEGYRAYLQHKYCNKNQPKHMRLKSLDQIKVAFHGTRKHNVGSIVRQGLMVPDDVKVKIANGSRYGRGIYASPDINFGFHYSRNEGRLLILATLPGKQYICTESYNLTDCKPGYDSHVSADNTEMVLFKNAQVLPCYVIHYEWLTDKQADPMHGIDRTDISSKDKQIKMKAQALKHLPYGFGPAGANFIVEEVADPDEDDLDEEYQNDVVNEYQKDREIW